MEQDLGSAKKEAFKIARDLLYPDNILVRIANATTVQEIDRILKTARKESINKADHIQDARIKEGKPKRKNVVVKKKPARNTFKCPRCGKPCPDDYYLVNCVRIKDGIPYFTKFQTLWCAECYNEIYEATKSPQKRS